jgi:hypothetical protein
MKYEGDCWGADDCDDCNQLNRVLRFIGIAWVIFLFVCLFLFT